MPAGPETLWGPGAGRGPRELEGATRTSPTLGILHTCAFRPGNVVWGGQASGELGAWGKLSSKVGAAGSARSLRQGPGPCSPGPATVLGGGLCWDQQLRKIHTCLWRCGEDTLCPWGCHESLKTRCGS